jgi:hypothetical protein
MCLSEEEKQSLKIKARGAKTGPWVRNGFEIEDDAGGIAAICGFRQNGPTDVIGRWGFPAEMISTGDFIAAANPAVVLALLDEIAHWKKQAETQKEEEKTSTHGCTTCRYGSIFAKHWEIESACTTCNNKSHWTEEHE